MTAAPPAPKATVVASMRNEGPFILEWLAWYRMLGFARALVVSNDCTDHSPALLDALAAQGLLDHLAHDVPPGRPITRAKLAAARRHPAVTGADWVFVCDADEFLVIHPGQGRLADLFAAAPPFLGMAINWRVFGTGGQVEFLDLPVHRQFFQAQAASRPLSHFVKTLFGPPDGFGELGEHGPRLWRGETGAHDWVDGAGRALPAPPAGQGQLRFLPKGQASHDLAQVNHYMLRSAESYSLKAGSLAPASMKPRYDAGYFRRADRADVIDAAALKYGPAFDAEHQAILGLPGIRRLHHLCCADHLRAIAVKAGRDPAGDARIAQHLALAEAAG